MSWLKIAQSILIHLDLFDLRRMQIVGGGWGPAVNRFVEDAVDRRLAR